MEHFNYGRFMAEPDDDVDLADDDEGDEGALQQFNFRTTKAAKFGIEQVAEIETLVRKMKGKRRSAVSATRVLNHVVHRFLLTFAAKYGPLPGPDATAAELERYATHVASRRSRGGGTQKR